MMNILHRVIQNKRNFVMCLKVNENMMDLSKNQDANDYLNRLKIHCKNNLHQENAMAKPKFRDLLKWCVSTISQKGFIQNNTPQFRINLMTFLVFKFKNPPQYHRVRTQFL